MMRIIISFFVLIIASTSFAGVCGDVNGNGTVDLLDVSGIIGSLYRGGPPPDCGTSTDWLCGDVNGDEKLNLLDVSDIINHLYRSGPPLFCGTVTDIDGNVYQAVKINGQWWLGENLKVTHYRNGDPIANVTDNAEWSGLTDGAYCDYGNDVSNADIYGRLYNWYAVGDSRNIAPAGWHVASHLDGIYHLMPHGNYNASGELKETGTERWSSPNAGAINIYGFSGLPGGFRGITGQYDLLGYSGYIWYSPSVDENIAMLIRMDYNSADLYFGETDKHKGFSVRCVKN
jgi:uncharacterized protein (TIGR02145 family)